MNGCEYCRDGAREFLFDIPDLFNRKNREHEMQIGIFGSDELTVFPIKNGEQMIGYEETLYINYCPMCGRKLKEDN